MEWRVVAVRKYPKEFTNEKDDETVPIINKLKKPKKRRGNIRNKKEGPTSKKTKEPPNRQNIK
jgi:hypothetical protein